MFSPYIDLVHFFQTFAEELVNSSDPFLCQGIFGSSSNQLESDLRSPKQKKHPYICGGVLPLNLVLVTIPHCPYDMIMAIVILVFFLRQ